MNSLSFILRAAAILAAALSAMLYFTSQGKLREMDDRLRAAIESAENAEAALDRDSAELEELRKALNSERAIAADAKRSVESLRAEIFTARQEVSKTQLELEKAREEIESLESTGRRLRQNLVETEQIFAKPNPQPEIEKLNARIIELENANLQLTRELHSARKALGKSN